MDTAQLIAILTPVCAATLAGIRWLAKLWATVRREGIEAQKAEADQQREANKLMVNALISSANAQTTLANKIDELPQALELVLIRWRDDDASERRRHRSAAGSPVPNHKDRKREED